MIFYINTERFFPSSHGYDHNLTILYNPPQKLFNRLSFCRRLHYDQVILHDILYSVFI